ncbi:ATP-binding protein [uncultured Anaeromusa sp.]|uniref:ATP-binding protein n=1 Tax=uncultured Anaeromusa sp. TaxID=673273 RepID=UPI0029C62927|nr:ATP-binding protein [uncultured Anaeromusa sp.]
MKSINLPPYAPVLMESIRAIGYSLETAIADIIDNSITASAKNVWINFFPIGEVYVAILDDGKAMNDEELTTAMQYGSSHPTALRTDYDLGRFGLGLKTASLSQCKTLTVISKRENAIEGRRWDLDYIATTGEWSLVILEQQEIEKLPQVEQLMSLDTGTLVLWQNLDRMMLGENNFEQSMGRKMDEVRKHLTLVYHRYLSGEVGIKKINLHFNDEKLTPQDPFLINKSVQAIADEILIVRGNKVIVRPYILPHISKLSREEIECLGGNEGLRKQQGFYIYRNKRLLVRGTWFKMMRQGELSKLVRIQVDIPNSLDDLWTLDIKKSIALPPAEVRKNLGVVINKMAEKSKRTWTYRGKKENDEKLLHVWTRMKTRTGTAYEINQNYPSINKLIGKYPDIKKDLQQIFKQIEIGLPLNSLYIDLVNDEKIDNDISADFNSILEMLKSLLKDIDDKKGKLELIRMLENSEPFCNYKEQISQAMEKGELL